MVTHYSIFVTHHSSLKIPQLPTSHPFGTITHLSSLNIFQLFVGLIPITWCSFYFFFFPSTPNTQTHRTQWKKKLTEPSEKKNSPNPVRKKKKSKVAADLTSGSLNVYLITEMPLKTELWKLKTPKMCFRFP